MAFIAMELFIKIIVTIIIHQVAFNLSKIGRHFQEMPQLILVLTV